LESLGFGLINASAPEDNVTSAERVLRFPLQRSKTLQHPILAGCWFLVHTAILRSRQRGFQTSNAISDSSQAALLHSY